LKVDPGITSSSAWNKNQNQTTPVHSFTVKDAGTPDDPAPKEDIVLKLFDYRFELNPGLSRGTQVIRVETPGANMHEVDIYRLNDGSIVAGLNR
jgi:hypothetical protein